MNSVYLWIASKPRHKNFWSNELFHCYVCLFSCWLCVLESGSGCKEKKTSENEQQLQKDSTKRYIVRCGCTIPRASAALLWHTSPQTERTILIRNSLWSYFNCFSRPRATISISGCKRPSIIRDYQTICLHQTIARTKYQSLKTRLKITRC